MYTVITATDFRSAKMERRAREALAEIARRRRADLLCKLIRGVEVAVLALLVAWSVWAVKTEETRRACAREAGFRGAPLSTAETLLLYLPFGSKEAK